MPNIAKACFRIPSQDLLFFEGQEESLSVFPQDRTGYVISNFEGTEFQFIAAKASPGKIEFSNHHSPGIKLDKSIDKHFFINYVKQIQSHIKSGEASKVVASRCNQIDLPDSFEINTFIQQLATTYPNAYISAYQGKKGTYVTATPELLLHMNNKGDAETMALAGTAKWEERDRLGVKEKEEQGFIVTHLQEVLDTFNLPYDKTAKSIVHAGHLAHLVNNFKFNLNHINLSHFLASIHPTPAVGVYPHSAGVSFITQNEGWNRGFFAGYSGIINVETQTTLAINLRSMLINGNKALLQAGAGITLESIPENEWLETEEKMKTIKNLIV